MENAASIVLTVLGLAVVLWLAYWTSRWVASKSSHLMQSKHMKILDRIMIAGDKWIALVQVGQRVFVIGVSGQRMDSLGEMDASEFAFPEKGEGAGKDGSFSSLFQSFLRGSSGSTPADSAGGRRLSTEDSRDDASTLLHRIRRRSRQLTERDFFGDGGKKE